MTEKNVAEMNAAEIKLHMAIEDQQHKRMMTALRALHRVRLAEESKKEEE